MIARHSSVRRGLCLVLSSGCNSLLHCIEDGGVMVVSC